MKKSLRLFLPDPGCCISRFTRAAGGGNGRYARAEGKIFVVVAMILIIFAGILAYLFLMDRKVTRSKSVCPKKGLNLLISVFLQVPKFRIFGVTLAPQTG